MKQLGTVLAIIGALWCGIAKAQNAYVISNAASTGTTVNTLTAVTGAPQTAVIAGTSAANGILGITVAGAGTTASAVIQFSGIASCVFDGATTANDWVVASSTTGGDCHDSTVAGSSAPPQNGNQIIGIVQTTNGGTGTYTLELRIHPTYAFLQTTVADQTLSGGANLTVNSIGVVTSGTTTVDCGKNPGQWFVNGGAFTLAAPTNDGTCLVKGYNNGNNGTVTFSGFREGTNTGDTVPTADRSTATATFTNTSAVIGWTNTLAANDPVYFTNSGGGLPTNFTANVVYYVSSTGLSGSQIEVSATPGGSVITAGSAGTGTQTGHAASSYTLSISRVNGLSKYLVSADQ